MGLAFHRLRHEREAREQEEAVKRQESKGEAKAEPKPTHRKRVKKNDTDR